MQLRIRALRSKDQQPQNVVEQNTAEGVSPNGVLRNPNRPNRAVSSYCLLDDVCAFVYLLSASKDRLNARKASFRGCDTELVGSFKTID